MRKSTHSKPEVVMESGAGAAALIGGTQLSCAVETRPPSHSVGEWRLPGVGEGKGESEKK